MFRTNCPDNCSLRPGTKFGDIASAMLVEGIPYTKVIAAGVAKGHSFGPSVLTRHRRHIVTEDQEDPSEKRTNIEILEMIIQKGFVNSKNWRPTINDTMKAMDMWFRLTQGNPFEELLASMADAVVEPENDPAELAVDEKEQSDSNE